MCVSKSKLFIYLRNCSLKVEICFQSSNPSANLKKKSYQFFSKRAQYQNKIVALKTVLPQYMTINRALMIEMKNVSLFNS